jgi:hypothetical protein
VLKDSLVVAISDQSDLSARVSKEFFIPIRSVLTLYSFFLPLLLLARTSLTLFLRYGYFKHYRHDGKEHNVSS